MEETQTYYVLQNVTYLYKKMWREGPKHIISFVLRAIADMLLPLLTSATIALIISIVSGNQSWNQAQLIFYALLALTAVCMIISETMSNYENSGGNMFRVSNMMGLSRKLLYLPFQKLEKPENISKLQKAGEPTQNNNGAFQKIFTVSYHFLRDSLGLLIYGYLIGQLHPLIIAVITIFSLLMYGYSLGTNRLSESIRRQQAPLSKKTKYLVDHTGDFKAVKDMRLFHMESWFEDEFQRIYAARFSLMSQLVKRQFKGTLLSSLFGMIRDALAYWLLINQVIDGSLSVASFSFYIGIIASISQWTNGLFIDLADFRHLSSEVQDYRDFMELDLVQSTGDRKTDDLSLPIDIEFRQVCYRYPNADRDTIHDLNLKITAGEKVGLVGVNGAGKTTIIMMLCGLYQPTSGEILINGIPQQEFNQDSYLDLFSAVFQDYFELPITIEETIQQAKTKYSLSYEEAVEQAGMAEILAKLPLGGKTPLVKRVHPKAVDLSGGQKQRLQLARALYKQSPVLILDEPTAALDPIAENEIYLAYNAISQNKTSLFISHRLSSTRFCDRIVYLENGSIYEEGSHQELLAKKGKYADMYQVQSQYYQEEWEGKVNDSITIA